MRWLEKLHIKKKVHNVGEEFMKSAAFSIVRTVYENYVVNKL